MSIRPGLQLLAAASLALSACASGKKSDNAPVPGGYSRGGDMSKFAHAAAFAAREESRRSGTPIRIVKIVRGDTQVVAGTNFRLRVTAVRNGATTETADVVVFHDLLGHDHLTSWRWRR